MGLVRQRYSGKNGRLKRVISGKRLELPNVARRSFELEDNYFLFSRKAALLQAFKVFKIKL